MKIFVRRFTSLDVVAAADEEDAKVIDWSEAADNLKLDDVEEMDAAEYKRRWAKNWGEHVPAGLNDDGLNLAEVFGSTPSGEVKS
jgi:hypothetical protein